MKMVFVAEPGSRIVARRGGIIIVGKGGKTAIPPDVDAVVIASSRVGISAKALRLASMRGIDIVILDSSGYPVARLYPPYINKTVATRIAQFQRFGTHFGKTLAKEFAYSKIINQAQLLKYLAKCYREPWLREVAYEIDAIATDLRLQKPETLDREAIMSFESRAARHYWQAIASILPPELGFSGRDQQGLDPFNAALNYGYGILYSVCERALLLAGLDPYLGVLHSIKSGKPSLTLDFVEMFRAIAVDKPLILSAKKLRLEIVERRLDYESRKMVAKVVLDNLSTRYLYSKTSRRVELCDIVKLEAWTLAKAVREGSEYIGFRAVF